MVEKKTPPLPSPAAQEREPPPSPEKKPIRRQKPAEPTVLAQAEPPALPEVAAGQTQIQFSTPGGTRIIWVLHPATE